MTTLKAALIVACVFYGAVCVLVAISLLRKKQNNLAVVSVIAALWPFTLPWGLSLVKKIGERAYEDIFSSYRGAGFDTLKIKNGRWVAGFGVADMDRGSQLVLVVPGSEIAPEDLQEVMAQPCTTPQEAILNSASRRSDWLRATGVRDRNTKAEAH